MVDSQKAGYCQALRISDRVFMLVKKISTDQSKRYAETVILSVGILGRRRLVIRRLYTTSKKFFASLKRDAVGAKEGAAINSGLFIAGLSAPDNFVVVDESQLKKGGSHITTPRAVNRGSRRQSRLRWS